MDANPDDFEMFIRPLLLKDGDVPPPDDAGCLDRMGTLAQLYDCAALRDRVATYLRENLRTLRDAMDMYDTTRETRTPRERLP